MQGRPARLPNGRPRCRPAHFPSMQCVRCCPQWPCVAHSPLPVQPTPRLSDQQRRDGEPCTCGQGPFTPALEAHLATHAVRRVLREKHRPTRSHTEGGDDHQDAGKEKDNKKVTKHAKYNKKPWQWFACAPRTPRHQSQAVACASSRSWPALADVLHNIHPIHLTCNIPCYSCPCPCPCPMPPHPSELRVSDSTVFFCDWTAILTDKKCAPLVFRSSPS